MEEQDPEEIVRDFVRNESPQRSVGVRPTHFEGQQVVETSCRSAKNADRV